MNQPAADEEGRKKMNLGINLNLLDIEMGPTIFFNKWFI